MENRSNGWALLGGLALGALGGFAVGLWVAPSLSGRWRSGLEGNLSQARQKASEVVDVVRDGTEHLIERTRDVIDEQMSRLDEAIEAAQKAAAEQAAAYRQRSGEPQESG